MTEEQRLFLVQAKSAFSVYKLLVDERLVEMKILDEALPVCHALHYLQMATELLGKASAWKSGKVGKSHKAFVSFLSRLSANTKAQARFGYKGQNENRVHTIRKLKPIAERLQKMAPALAQEGPNPEYPWPPDAPSSSPVEFDFPIWRELTETSSGHSLMRWIHSLFEAAEEYL